MTSNRVRWGRLKLSQSVSEDELFVDSPAKSLKTTRFRRKSDYDAYGRNFSADLEGTSPAQKKGVRFRRESGDGGVAGMGELTNTGLKAKLSALAKRPPTAPVRFLCAWSCASLIVMYPVRP